MQVKVNEYKEVLNAKSASKGIKIIQEQNAAQKRLDGWFYIQEIRMNRLLELNKTGKNKSNVMTQALLFASSLENMELSIREGEIFAGTQADSFARTYALINPAFKVESFEGYCDPIGVYNDITPDAKQGISRERINKVKTFWSKSEFAAALRKVYEKTGLETKEVVYFVEQVTGHTIADFKPALAGGIEKLIFEAKKGKAESKSQAKKEFYEAAELSLKAVIALADRYSALAKKLALSVRGQRKAELELIAETCPKAIRYGADNLYEAVQIYILLWMAMTVEQCPNPFAFSVGNIDRVLLPYYEKEGKQDRALAVELVRHLLALFNVGDRNWAISQNLMVGGKDEKGNDLTSEMTGIVLDAFYASNYPQPALSVKLHKNTPEEIYSRMNKFLLTPGHSTPSLFNDDLLFEILKSKGIKTEDLKDYSIAGCQEALIMGKESGNTTNSWLNLAKVLELTLNDGKSAITGEKIGLSFKELGLNAAAPFNSIAEVKKAFYRQLDYFLPHMKTAANDCTKALSLLPVPFLSSFMGGLDTGVDMRDWEDKGTMYNGSGCLIHGMAVVADSFTALKHIFDTKEADVNAVLKALKSNFKGEEKLRMLLIKAPKYGNDDDYADSEAIDLVKRVSTLVNALKNPWGNNFSADWSTPSTHLLYGYWVGATPDGRRAREMLNYGLDPSAGMAVKGLPPRVMSMQKLPFMKTTGGYASHIGISASSLKKTFFEAPGEIIRRHFIEPLFGYNNGCKKSYYVYFNVDTPEHLRTILRNPKKLCPLGIYIMRIHGTFVNFLDLSPAIQEDIITRLDFKSTAI